MTKVQKANVSEKILTSSEFADAAGSPQTV